MKHFNCIVALITFTLLFISKSAISANFPPLTKYHEPIACSNEWANLAQTCPSNVKTFIANRDNYPKYTSCPASSPSCNEEWGMMQTVEHTYLFVNADTGQASRWVMALTPEVKRPNGQIIQAGKKVVSQQATTAKDIEVGNLFNQAKEKYDNLRALGTLVYTASGVMDGHGNYQTLSSHHQTCQTAINYFNNDNNCEGDLNTAIDLAVQNDVAYHSFVEVLEQLGQVVKLTTPFGAIDLTGISSFQWVITYPDGSKLFLNMKIKNGHVAISPDLGFSRTSTNQSFSSFLSRSTIYSEYFAEALSVAQSKSANMSCTTRTLPFGIEVKVKAVKIQGNKVTFIYNVNDIEKSFTYCS